MDVTATSSYNTFGVKVSPVSSIQSAGLSTLDSVVDKSISPANIASGNLTSEIGLVDGFLQSSNFETGVQGWQISSTGDVEFNDGVFRGDLQAVSLNIPDTTTTASFHVDSTGNMWSGANVANKLTAPVRISSTGAAYFENVTIGGSVIQYVITNSGIFSFGDGSDGTATCDGSTTVTGMSRSGSVYTLTRDVYFDSLTVNNSVSVNMAGYRVFVKNTLTNAGTIHRNGVVGGNGNNGGTAVGGGGASSNLGGGGGAGGTALADGYLKGSLAGAAGGAGGNGSYPGDHVATAGVAGSNGVGVSNSINVSAGAGVNGVSNAGSGLSGGTGGTAGTATASNVKLIANWHLATLLDISSTGATVKFTGAPSSGGSGGSAGGSNRPSGFNDARGGGGGGGGGAGSAGGIGAIYARKLVNTGSITVTGGNGGNGGTGGAGEAGVISNVGGDGGSGGSGGVGGNGGTLVLAYNELTNSGSITADGGSAGTGGAGGAGAGISFSNGTAGTVGNAGSSGVIYQFQLSL